VCDDDGGGDEMKQHHHPRMDFHMMSAVKRWKNG
jgi:hypothetical protein